MTPRDESPPQKLVIASHNPGKVREIAELLAPLGVAVVSAAELDLPEPDETGQSFAENAALKARAAAEGSGLPALSDDSGLAVAALGGQPGIYSARWAGPERSFLHAMERVERELRGQEDRRAAFICALCLAWPSGRTRLFEGRVEGEIVWPPRGARGFGYDPIFRPLEEKAGLGRSFAEMDPAEKHAISHRARAFALLVETVFPAPS